MSRYVFSLDCLTCGGDLTHVTGGTSAGTESRAVAHCPACNRDYLVSAFLRPFGSVIEAERKRRERASA